MKQQKALWLAPEPRGAASRVFVGILHDLEAGRMVPGQRIVETDLAIRFEVGRNAVREALQHLTARGVVDPSPNRSPAIRQLDFAESMEVLDVAAALTQLAARSAAAAYRREEHCAMLDNSIVDLTAAVVGDGAAFSRARRNFYRVLLMIGGNRELQRLFPAVGMHIIHAQYPLPMLQAIRQRDYPAMADAISASAVDRAEAVALQHVENVRAAITDAAGR